MENDFTSERLQIIPIRYREARIKDSPIPLLSDESIYFWSKNPGTGKTHLAWAFYINERLKNGKQEPIFSTFGGLQLQLRKSINSGITTEDEEIKKLSNCKLLVLDDLGGLRPGEASDYSLSMVFEILNNRYSWNRQTIITGNKNLEEIENDFDARIASRIMGFCRVIELKGEDRRLVKK